MDSAKIHNKKTGFISQAFDLKKRHILKQDGAILVLCR